MGEQRLEVIGSRRQEPNLQKLGQASRRRKRDNSKMAQRHRLPQGSQSGGVSEELGGRGGRLCLS